MFRKIMVDQVDVKAGIASILQRIDVAYSGRSKEIKAPKPQLIAVSKTKPVELIIDAYCAGQRHFGENYVNELAEKAVHEDIIKNCPDIKWHFIGHLQTNKINKVLKSPGIEMVETIDSEKLAKNVDATWSRLDVPDKSPLKVLIQINTSGEAEKNGVIPDEASALYKIVKDKYKNLSVEGIMTIGAFGHDYSIGHNPDFIALMKCHKQICEEHSVQPDQLQVSMGMSDDFEKASSRPIRVVEFQTLRKEARHIENEIDMKLVAFSKVSTGATLSTHSSSADTSPLLGEHVYDTLSDEISGMLDRLSALNETMADHPTHGAAAMHTLQRHRDILQGYRQEFNKICSNHTSRVEREELLRGSGLSSSAGQSNSPLSSGLSRRDMYMKEAGHIQSSSSMLNDQISIAIETKEHLMSQRHSFKRIQTRFNDMSNKYPLINSLIQRINIRKRRDSLILGAVIGICTVLLLFYAFS